MATAVGSPIELTGVTKRFGDLVALDGVSLAVAAGTVTGVVGPSGCGKSTLLELIAGLEEPSAGTLAVAGHPAPAGRLDRCALMPQSDLLMPWRDALGNASVAIENRGGGRRRARAEARPLFERLGLEGFERTRTWELSGGMRQRVAFARTLLAGKDVLLLDEPFGALDAITRAELQEWLRAALLAEPRTTVLVTHDIEEALLVCDRVAVMSTRPGRIVLELAAGYGDGERAAAIASPPFLEARSRALAALR
ncbi:MAG TPA: ATP-binding cassette domain-containing protein [Gaiellales bacterium]